MNHPVYILKADGVREPFDPSKLIYSLHNAGVTGNAVDDVVQHVQTHIKDGMTTGEIYSYAFHYLRSHSLPIALRYSLRRALSELGPNGFPFEKFVAEIFKAKGYEVLTDQVVQGACVQHEIDVVAWNDKELIMVEAKFHNEFGLKSDLKVALYIKARFDDLRHQTFTFGGKSRTMTDGWLVTNTKFTDQAIKYGSCQQLKMVGWNYPHGASLQDLIEGSGLHPFTCLGTLTANHKKQLLDKGIILCRDIKRNPHVLKEISMSTEEIAKVFAEIDTVCGA